MRCLGTRGGHQGGVDSLSGWLVTAGGCEWSRMRSAVPGGRYAGDSTGWISADDQAIRTPAHSIAGCAAMRGLLGRPHHRPGRLFRGLRLRLRQVPPSAMSAGHHTQDRPQGHRSRLRTHQNSILKPRRITRHRRGSGPATTNERLQTPAETVGDRAKLRLADAAPPPRPGLRSPPTEIPHDDPLGNC